MLEKQIEKAVCDYAKSKGMLVYKFSSPGHASVPDRMFILPGGHMFMIELKSAKGKVTPAQEREHDRLRGHKVSVFVVNDIDQGKAVIDCMVGAIWPT
jgi:hypothetical protein